VKFLAVVVATLALAGCGGSTHSENEHRLKSLDTWTGYCGTERAAVKHTVDSAASSINTTPQRTTIAILRGLPVPSELGGSSTPRLAQEKQVVKLVGSELVFVKTESDGDFHMGLENPTDYANHVSSPRTVIAEAIPSSCASGSPFLSQITAARAEVQNLQSRLPLRVTITGVRYFDFNHGQTFIAPNAIELHPVLSITPYLTTP